MSSRTLIACLALLTCWSAAGPAAETAPGSPPEIGPVEILPLDEVRAGMQGVAWTTFVGTAAEPIPVEILGRMKNAWGPRQDVILAKLGGKAERTNVAGGMSGSPVYVDGKLIGAIALRFSVFSPDAIAGITPIELMLEIDELNRARPLGDETETAAASVGTPMAEQVWAHRDATMPSADGRPAPIETPLMLSGVHSGAIDLFSGQFARRGVRVMQAGAAAGPLERGSAAGALKPGEPIGVVLMSGDMSATALGTVSYNDGRKVLGFGHAMFNSGPIEAPIATGEVLTVLASKFAPVKIANASTVVGALRQDRHSGILGILDERAELVPVEVRVRSLDDEDRVASDKTLNFEIFQNERWTPQLLMLALFNSMFGMNDFAEESTFRLKAEMEFHGDQRLEFETMQTVSEQPVPAPLLLAGSVAGKLQRVFMNTRQTPRMKQIDVSIDLLPRRRQASIEQIWVENSRVRAGETVRGKVILQPFRGPREERDFSLTIPAGAERGRVTLLAANASVFDQRPRMAAARSRSMTLPETFSALNRERSNDRVYITALDRGVPTAWMQDQSLPGIPLTALNVMRPAAQGRLIIEGQSPLAEVSLPARAIVSGARSVTIQVD